MSAPDQHRLVKVTLDEGSIGRSNPDVEHERAVAIYDLLEDNSFHPRGHEGGPYELALSITSLPMARQWSRITCRSARCGASSRTIS
jgi:uncharacterized protein (UPF0262 family)